MRTSQIDFNRQQLPRIKSFVGVDQRREALEEQRGGHDACRAQGDFGSDQRGPEPRGGGMGLRVAAAFQRALQVGTRRPPGRDEPDQRAAGN